MFKPTLCSLALLLVLFVGSAAMADGAVPVDAPAGQEGED